MANVLLLRHGRTTANADGTLAGRSATELDGIGVDQARAVGARLAGLPLRLVVTSPLRRCQQTVELACPGLPVDYDDGLVECGYGDWEGKRLSDLVGDPLWPVVQQHPAGVTFPGRGGEAMAAMAARAVAAIRQTDARISDEHGPDALWLACAHGDVLKAIIADALGLHLDLFQRIVVDPASVSVIRYAKARTFVLRLNDTGDLSGLAAGGSVTSGLPESDAAVGGGSGSASGPLAG